jgi:hypothetical protein
MTIEHTSQAQQAASVMHPTSPARVDAPPAAEEVPIDYGVHAPYIAALRAVYDEDGTAFADCIDTHPHILEMLYQGWPLLHHIAQWGWKDGIEIYRRKNGRMDIKSEDFVSRFAAGIHLTLVGGQTLLHVTALYQQSSFGPMTDMFPQANTADYNQRLPAYYLTVGDIPKHDQDLVLARVAQQSVISLEQEQQQQHRVTFDEEDLMDGVRCFELPAEFCASLLSDISQLQQSIPNSMHRYGKILLPHMQRAVHSLVASVLPAGDAQRVSHIHAFYIQYSEEVGQKSLDSHADDSHWTINLCLAVSHDLQGSELVFDPDNVTCASPTLPSTTNCDNAQVHPPQSWSRHHPPRRHAPPRGAAALRQPRKHHRVGQPVAALLTLRDAAARNFLSTAHAMMVRGAAAARCRASREEGAHALRYHGSAQGAARDFVCRSSVSDRQTTMKSITKRRSCSAAPQTLQKQARAQLSDRADQTQRATHRHKRCKDTCARTAQAPR